MYQPAVRGHLHPLHHRPAVLVLPGLADGIIHGGENLPLWKKENIYLTHFCPPFQHLLSERLTSLGIMGTTPRVPPLNPSETIVL